MRDVGPAAPPGHVSKTPSEHRPPAGERLRPPNAPGVWSVSHAAALLLTLCAALALLTEDRLGAAGALQSPEQFIGFKVGSDNKLVRWEKIVEYMRLAAGASDRVRVRELGKKNSNHGVNAVEIRTGENTEKKKKTKKII